LILPCHADSDIANRFFARDLFIPLMMDAVRTSESSVYFNETARRYIPEGLAVRTWNVTVSLDIFESSPRDLQMHSSRINFYVITKQFDVWSQAGPDDFLLRSAAYACKQYRRVQLPLH
jgi:hypothetical protein